MRGDKQRVCSRSDDGDGDDDDDGDDGDNYDDSDNNHFVFSLTSFNNKQKIKSNISSYIIYYMITLRQLKGQQQQEQQQQQQQHQQLLESYNNLHTQLNIW